ncbi:MAG: hypothetical protein IPJ89_01115 [Candidatus Iainarchaeum archaeon]|uniref:Uncharacterized protein n=1 Tax=Candidatus Iainarchaeum sp. TaxID=3101447 RepID=A0A7T9I2J2_9ARCH|nr:MAG: hypothetical protein IPJ89_01115 [Candidatus Diapherotrites archaeon]
MVFQNKAEEIPLHEAIARIQLARNESRETALKLMALRMASQKYLWNTAQRKNWTSFMDATQAKALIPSVNTTAWVDYARTGMDFFTTHVEPLWQRHIARMSERDKMEYVAWSNEWKQNLEELRRIWAQRIESAWSERAHALLEEVVREDEAEKRIALAAQHARKEFYRTQDIAASANAELIEFESDESFNETKRLIEMQDACVEEKQTLERRWKEEWDAIAPILEILSNETQALQQMEMAQVQLLANYVKNPAQARARDPHATALKRLIELALHEVEKNEWPLPTAQMQEYERRLRHALHEKFFERTFWKGNELEVESQQLQKALQEKESYRRWIAMRTTLAQAKQEEEKWKHAWQENEAHSALQRKRLQQATAALNALLSLHTKWQLA